MTFGTVPKMVSKNEPMLPIHKKKYLINEIRQNDSFFVGFTVSPQIDTIPVPTVTPTAPATTTKAGNFS
jgi:hypothetical protein